MSSARSKYMPHLDGLRALAALSVAFEHWCPNYCMGIPFGSMGVILFFQLSGFLISGIVLDNLPKLQSRGDTLHFLKAFFIRRTLRIFPIFYLTVIGLAVLDFSDLRESWPWHLSYLSNFAFFFEKALPGYQTVFWSLAVEEQFYLVWPLTLILLRKHLSVLVLCVFFVTLASWLPPFNVTGDLMGLRIPPRAFLGMAMGALLAIWHRGHLPAAYGIFKNLAVGAIGVIILFASFVWAVRVLWSDVTDGTRWSVTLLAFYLPGLWILDRAARAELPSIVSRILLVRPLVILGKISYGFYLLHFFVPLVTDPIVAGYLGESSFVALLVKQVVRFIAAILVASASFYLFENPINRNKRHFPYLKTA